MASQGVIEKQKIPIYANYFKNNPLTGRLYFPGSFQPEYPPYLENPSLTSETILIPIEVYNSNLVPLDLNSFYASTYIFMEDPQRLYRITDLQVLILHRIFCYHLSNAGINMYRDVNGSPQSYPLPGHARYETLTGWNHYHNRPRSWSVQLFSDRVSVAPSDYATLLMHMDTTPEFKIFPSVPVKWEPMEHIFTESGNQMYFRVEPLDQISAPPLVFPVTVYLEVQKIRLLSKVQ